jgi:hypothetical protein
MRTLTERRDRNTLRVHALGGAKPNIDRFTELRTKSRFEMLSPGEQKELSVLMPIVEELQQIRADEEAIKIRVRELETPFVFEQERIVNSVFPELIDVDFRNADQRVIPKQEKPFLFSYDVDGVGAHTIALIPKDGKLYYYDPTGNPMAHAFGPGDLERSQIKRFANGRPIIENRIGFQREFGSCFSMSTHAALDPVCHEERARKYRAAQDLTGLTAEEISMIAIQQAADAKYLERGYVPAPSYKKGGIVYGRKYNH